MSMAAIDPRRRETLVYMTISAAKPGRVEKSVEEIRIEDYLKAYSTTGRPPIPCPSEPTGDRERLALGLPILFQPYIEDSSGDSGGSTVVTPVVSDPTKLPPVQLFQPTRIDTGEFLHSIVLQADFCLFSPEELRCHAYAKGNIYPPNVLPLPELPPLSLPAATVGLPASTPAAISPYFSRDSPSTAYNTQTGPSGAEYYMSISAGVKHAKHSLEELRVSYSEAGREPASPEILQSKSRPTNTITSVSPGSLPSSSSVFGQAGGGAFSLSPPAGPF